MYLTDPVCQSRRLWAQTVSRQSTSLHSANSEMFISKATCAAQPFVRRMSHPQATSATSEVGSGQAPGGECGGAEKHCWAITALLTFCHIVSQQGTLSGKGNCKSLSTKVAPTVMCVSIKGDEPPSRSFKLLLFFFWGKGTTVKKERCLRYVVC